MSTTDTVVPQNDDAVNIVRDYLTLFGALSSIAAAISAVLIREQLRDELGRHLNTQGWSFWVLFALFNGLLVFLGLIVLLFETWRGDWWEARKSSPTLSRSEKIRAALAVAAVAFGVVAVIGNAPVKTSYGYLIWYAASTVLVMRSWTDYERAKERERQAEQAERQRAWWRALWSRLNPLGAYEPRSAADRFAIEWVWFIASCIVAAIWVMVNGIGDGWGAVLLGGGLLGIPVYLALGVIRVTLWSVRRVFRRSS